MAPSKFAIETVSDPGRFLGLREEWNAVLQESRSDTIFLTWEWASSWWDAYGEGKELWILLVRRAGRLVGIAPFYRTRSVWKPRPYPAALRFIGDGSADTDYLDLIAREGEEAEVATAVAEHLARTTGRWTLLALNEMPADSPLLARFRDALARAGFRLSEERVPCAATDLPADWESYVKSLKPRMRSKVRALRRRFAEDPGLSFETLEREAGLEERLQSLYALHEARWNTAGQAGVFVSEAKRKFYRSISRHFLANGWLRFYSLRHNDRYIAHQYCFGYRNKVLLLQEGYDPTHADDAAGNLLRARVFAECIDSRVAVYDFLGGVSSHKLSWGASAREMSRVLVAHRGLLSRFFFSLPAVKRFLEPAVHRLRAFGRSIRDRGSSGKRSSGSSGEGLRSPGSGTAPPVS
jgi:CelD/BcsL family acetyltransferase involved in cellulose biosynthesis